MSQSKLIGGAVSIIGIAMIVMHINAGLLVPPVMSGIAFVLLGFGHCFKQ